MIRALLLSVALAASAPVLAQQGAEDSQPAQQGSLSGAAANAPANAAHPVARIVDAEFPAYDSNGDGKLDRAEFSRWMMALKDQEMKATGTALPPAQIAAWVSGAFTTADIDRNRSVSKAELIAYLSGGAR
ncbi:MAG: EF-hand domain-containing protein [Sphingobium sp.]